MQYAASDGYFLDSVTNAAGHTTTTTYDARSGTPTAVVDPKGLRASTTPDNFGRTTSATAPAAAGNVLAPPQWTARQWCGSGRCNAAPNALFRVATEQAGSPKRIEYFDRAGQLVRSEHAGFSVGQNPTPTIASTRVYNDRGELIRETAPAYAPATGALTEYYYDILGRMTRKLAWKSDLAAVNPLADGNLNTIYTYDGIKTSIKVCRRYNTSTAQCEAFGPEPILTMERGIASDGRVLWTVDALQGVTRFVYGATGAPILIRDAKGVDITATYDSLGRRTQSVDPNRGTWNFTYNGLGELLTQTDARGLTLRLQYDDLGRVQERTWRETDPLNDSLNRCMRDTWVHDTPAAGLLGEMRRERVSSLPGESCYLDASRIETFVRQYAYSDPLWRETTATTTAYVGGTTTQYAQETRYDANYGRVNQVVLPGGVSTYRTFSPRGDLLEEAYVEDFRGFDDQQGNSQNAYLRRVAAMTERDQVSQVRLARASPTGPHGMLREVAYDASTGWAKDVQTCPGGVSTCPTDGPIGQAPSNKPVHYKYNYDAFGNVVQQLNSSWRPNVGGTVQPLNGQVHSLAIREEFDYDELHRLEQVRLYGGGTVNQLSLATSYAHDEIGNLRYKSDFSATGSDAAGFPYRYATSGKPYAVSSVKRSTGSELFYTYDANGNLASKREGSTSANPVQRFQHDIDNRPLTMFENSSGQVGLMFHYAPDGQRYVQHAAPSTQGASDTYYLEKAYEKEVFATGTIEERYYVAEGVLFVKDNRGEGSKTGTYWVHTDRLGSSISTTDALGQAKLANPTELHTAEVRNFEAFGKVRNGWSGTPSPALGTTNPRGFTQHEHLDAAGLVHMNGRAYDPHLGRFLGVDPIIQFPTNSQSLNPYSYLMNSPLAGTDPSGYMQSICDHPSAAGGSSSCVSGMTTTGLATAVKDALAGGGASYTRRNGGGTVRVVLVGNGGTQRISGTGPEGRNAENAGANEKGRMSDQGGACGFALCNAIATSLSANTQQDVPIDPRYPNILYFDLSPSKRFKREIERMIKRYDEEGITTLADLDAEAAKANMPVVLSEFNPETRKRATSMKAYPYPSFYMIALDSLSGLDLGNDRGVQSPSLGFLHEAEHGIRYLRAPPGPSDDKMAYLKKQDDDIIKGPEAEYADIFDEPPRRRHSEGTPVRVRCSTCVN